MDRPLIESVGYQVFDDFLSNTECKDVLNLIASYRQNNELPVIHRPMKTRSLTYSVIDGDRIKKGLSWIWNLYQHRVNTFINQQTKSEIVPLTNDRAGVNVNIMQPNGSEYRWHYDRTSISAILYLNGVEGGETELYPNYRILLKSEKYGQLQDTLDRILRLGPIRWFFGKKILIRPKQGRLVVFRGNRCWHSVRPVQGDQERINLVLAYDFPGATFPMEEKLDAYLYTLEEQTTSDPNYR